MEGFEDQPLPLRGPSLPGSLGVRVREHWEVCGEELEGISMRSNVQDANVQLDFMKGEERYAENTENEENERHDGIMMENGLVEGVNIQREDKRRGENVRGKWETFGKHGGNLVTQDVSMQVDPRVQSSEERGLDETGRKVPLPLQTNNNGHSHISSSSEHRVSANETNDLKRTTSSSDSFQSLNRTDTERHVSLSDIQAVQHSTPSTVSDDSFDTSSSFRRAESPDPKHPLPDGKKYHVFFSYEMADRDWVHSVVDKMETEHGYRCSFHERDFHGGKRVIENIMEHIQCSVKTVLILSPDFLESGWCQYEMKQGLHASIEEARMLIVPVMVRECEVPDTLRSLTYIDATPGTDWWGRFMEAVAAQDSLLICNADRNQVTIQPRFENLDVLCELSSSFHCSYGERLDVPYTPEALSKPGLEVPNDEFHIATSLLRTAQNTCFINRYLCDYTPACAPLFVIYCLGVVACIIAGRIFLGGYPDPNDPSAWTLLPKAYVLFTVPLLFFFIFIVWYFLQIKLRKGVIRRAAVKVNRRLLQYKILTGVSVSSLGHCSSLKMKV